MENIILQITMELVQKLLEKTMKSHLANIDTLLAELEIDCKETALEVVKAFVQETNKQIREDKARRKAEGLVLKEKNRERKMLTTLGTLEIERDYYYDKTNRKYIYLLDEVCGIKKYERICDTINANMVNLAADISYAKSAEIATEGKISRQSVRNHILKVKIPNDEIAKEKRVVKELHVYADEDHVHMQKPEKERGKCNQILPLVTVTEGTEKESKRRNRTFGTKHFVNNEFDGKKLWETVSGYICATYDIDKIEKIYVHGDGGRWITNGLNEFIQTEHVMDGYHLGKSLRTIARAFPNRNVRVSICNMIKNNEKERANEYLENIARDGDEKQTEIMEEFKIYLNNNWEAIRGRKVLDIPGSCTEGMVSHVLSERFSRNPMGWGKKALGQLSCIRVSKINGRKINANDFEEKEKTTTYAEYAEQLINENISGTFDWSIFDGNSFVFDKSSATMKLISYYGTNYGVIN